MLQFRLVMRATRLALVSCICAGAVIGASTLAMAKEHETASGYSGNASVATAQSRRGLCFTTNNAVEAERGIRHWNNCK